MHKLLSATFVSLFMFASTATGHAQGVSLEAAAVALGVNDISGIEYSGAGKWYRFGQGPVLTRGWQQNDVTAFTTTMDFIGSAERVTMVRAETPAAPPVTPIEPDQVDELVSGPFAWRMMGGAAQPQPAARDDRLIDIWASPQGFLKAALAENATVSAVAGGAEVIFTREGRKFIGRLNAAHQVESVRTWLANSTFGDLEVTYTYSGYRDFGGVRFPSRIVRSQGGFPVWDLNVQAVKANPGTKIVVPDSVRTYKVPPVRLDILQIADGVFVFQGGMYNSVAIEQSDRVVVVEAPLDEARSLAVIDKIKAVIPGKPIKYVINTHAHLDHSGGLRTFVADGATVVTDAVNRRFFEEAWKAPHSLQPDNLARKGIKPVFQTMTGKYVIRDAVRPIEIYPVLNSAHVDAVGPRDGLRMIYLPEEKFLIQADGYSPGSLNEDPPATPDPDNLNLYHNLKTLDLEVRLLVPLHGVMAHMPDLLKAVGKDKLPVEEEGGCKQEIFYC